MTTSSPQPQPVRLYPIEVALDADGVLHKSNAYRITDAGMMLEVFINTFTPQQVLKLKWTLPIDNIAMEEDAVVVKKYTQQRNNKMVYLVEVHFKNPKPGTRESIRSLLSRYEEMLKKQGEKKEQ